MKADKAERSGAHNKEFSARVMAVQAYYQVLHNGTPVRTVMDESLERGAVEDVEGEDLARPHGGLFKRILSSLDARLADVDDLVKGAVHKDEDVAQEDVAEAEESVSEDVVSSDVEGAADEGETPEEAAEPEAPVIVKDIEPLLKAVLYCGVAELLAHDDVDTALLIDDYLNVTHSFYEQQQVSFVHGILDGISKAVRA